jgi:tetratricopeptide (TPR) repeat protein
VDDVGSTEGSRPQGTLPIGGFLGALPSGVMVGRNAEWDRVMASVDEVTGSRGQLVLLSGEPGIGKTRLAQEVTLKVRNRGFLVATGRCYEQEQGVPFYPFLEALNTVFGAAPAGLRAEIPRRWPHLIRLLPDQIDPLRVARLDGQEDQQRLYRAVTQFLEEMALVTPVALLLDDLHWADDSTLKLLQHLARYTRASRILLLGTYRDVEMNRQHPLESALLDLNRDGIVQEVEIRRLGADATRALVAEIMGNQAGLEDVAELVYRRTEGNAFFIQEMLRALVERGDLYRYNGHWEQRKVREMEVPKSIRSVIGQRLSRLSVDAQEMLRAASVLGHTFTFDDVSAMSQLVAAQSGREGDTQLTEDEVDNALVEAVSAGLIRETGPDAYAFNHALTQQTLYAELSTRRKKRLHLAAGSVLEGLIDRSQSASMGRWTELALHFSEGDDSERALVYALLAGDAAEDVFAHGEAERQYRSAVELAHDLQDAFREAESREKLAGVLAIVGRYDDALESLETAMRLHRAADDVEGEACAAAQFGNIHFMRGTTDEGIDRLSPLVEVLEARAEEGRPSYGLAAVHAALARLYQDKRWHAKQLEASRRAAELAHIIGDERLLAGAEITHSDALWNMGEDENALRVLEELIPRAEAYGDLNNLGRALANAASYYARRGDFLKDRVYFERMLAVAERRGDRGQIVLGLIALSGNAYLTGKWEQSSAYLDRADAILSKLSTSRVSGWPAGARAWLELRKGNLDRATALADETLAIAQSVEDIDWQQLAARVLAERDVLLGQPESAMTRLEPFVSNGKSEYDPGFMRTLARVHLEIGHIKAAGTASEKSIAQATAMKDQPELVECLIVRGAVLARERRFDEARQIFDYALAGARRMPFPLGEALALQETGLMLLTRGDREVARERLEEAATLFDGLGARVESQRTLRFMEHGAAV